MEQKKKTKNRKRNKNLMTIWKYQQTRRKEKRTEKIQNRRKQNKRTKDVKSTRIKTYKE